MLDELVRAELDHIEGRIRLLDCAAGIGTQAIPLAKRGYQVYATDLSPAAIQRARELAEKAGVTITAEPADMRTLSEQIDGPFDVVISCDNALPHLLTDEELQKALLNIRSILKPGGLFLASIRDYDAVLKEKPQFTSQRVMGDAGNRRIVFQVWDWHDGGDIYTVNQFILTQQNGDWHTRHYATDYRALLRATLTECLNTAGYTEIHWEMDTYYQPIVIAFSPKNAEKSSV